MIFNQTNKKGLRDLFCDAVTKIFGDSMTFLDFLEDEKYSTKYDCYLDCNGENYIINRETGEYINWYKLDHIGRDIHVSIMSMYKIDIPKWFEEFLVEFKESKEGNTNDSTEKQALEYVIKKYFEPVEDKPGYVWFSKRDCRIISIETLAKLLEDERMRYGTQVDGLKLRDLFKEMLKDDK